MSTHRVKGTKKVSHQARWTDLTGKRRAKNFGTKQAALQFEAEMKTAVRRGDYTNPHSAKVRLRVVHESWSRNLNHLKPKTKASYEDLWRCMVEPTWGDRTLASISKAEIKVWISESKSSTGKVVSASRMGQAYVLLKLILNHAIELDYINRNPAFFGAEGRATRILPKPPIQKQKRALEKNELMRLANEAGEYRLMILVAGMLGLRWAELIGLTPEDFNFKSNPKTLTLNKSVSEINGRFELVTPKSGKSRILPIPNVLLQDLRALTISTKENSPIFSSPKGNYIRHSNFMRRVFKPALERAGIQDLTFHELRDTAISQAIASGADVIALSKIVGHSNAAITLKVYGHLLNNSMEGIQKAIDSSYANLESDKNVTNEISRPA